MDVIATIPYAPRRKIVPGYLLGPFSAHLVASHTGVKPLICVNSFGSKGFSRTDGDRFLQTYERLTEHTPLIWRDDSQNWRKVLASWASIGMKQGWLTVEPREVWKCACGLVEFLPEPLNLVGHAFKRKAYSIEGDMAWCNLCLTPTKRLNNDVLLMRLPADQPSSSLYPSYATKEWNNLGKQLNGKQILMSRSRQTGLEVHINSSHFNVDVDICSMLMPYVNSLNDIRVTKLICGHKTLK